MLGEPVELIADALTGRVLVHELEVESAGVPCPGAVDGKILCCSYVSQGLSAVGQREVVLTLRHARDAQGPHYFPFRLFADLYRLARDGGRFDLGEISIIAAEKPFGRERHGILYLPAHHIDGLALPNNALYGLLLMPDEVEAALAFGHARVTAWIGWSLRQYPWPRWSDADRASAIPAGASQSILCRTPRARIPGLHTLDCDDTLTLLCTPASRAGLRQMLTRSPRPEVLGFLTSPHAGADAQRVWNPSAQTATVIGGPHHPVHRITGNFLAVTGIADTSQIRWFEDGHGLLLTPAAFNEFCDALEHGRPLTLPLQDGRRLVVECLPERLDSIGGSFFSDGGWTSVAPADANRTDEDAAVKVQRIIILQAQHEVARTSKDRYTACLEALQLGVKNALDGAAGPGFDLAVRLNWEPPVPPRVGIGVRPPIDEDLVRSLEVDVLRDLAKIGGEPAGPIRCEVQFIVRGGSGTPFGTD
jgi:hypothetical protein